MMRIINSKLQIIKYLKNSLSFIIYTLFFAPSVFAQCPGFETDFGCLDQSNPAKFGSQLYNIGLGFIGAVSLLFIVYGGYLILSSQGNIDQLNKGKSYIFYSIAGLILAVAGYAFYQIIARDVIKIPGFTTP